MNATVTARVPLEVRNQVHAKLKAVGLTPTELINQAYLLFLATEALPEIPSPAKTQRLSRQQISDFNALVQQTTLSMAPEDQDKSFDELREQAMRDRFPESWN